MRDSVTLDQLEMFISLLPKEEVNHWGISQLNVSLEELPAAFHRFVKERIIELRKDISAQRERCSATTEDDANKCGLALSMRALYGRSRMPESCSIFDTMLPKGRLAKIQRKQLCQCWFLPTTDPAHSQRGWNIKRQLYDLDDDVF